MRRREFYKEEKLKKYIYVFGVTLILSIVVFLTIFVLYNKKMKNDANSNFENLGMIEDIVSNDDLEETSFSSDVTVEEKVSNTVKNISNQKNENKIDKTPIEATITNTTNTVSANIENVIDNTNVIQDKTEEVILEFQAPVAGEIIKDFAVDNLIYSNTLEEWTTHSGIDIKSEKTSIVVAAEAGTVESIKNDPRYGLTITIAHSNGFKTIYSNLLTTEFVSEEEVVEKGQTIGTVGETASFEVAEEPHIHFEMYKDGNPVNPTIYLK